MTLIGVLFQLVFVIYFVYVGTWRLSIIPVSVVLLRFLYAGQERSSAHQLTPHQLRTFLLRYAFSFAWVCIMLGGRGLADIYSLTDRMVSLYLVGINIFLWLVAYLIDYEDGKQMFHVGYYVASFVLVGSVVEFLDSRHLINLGMSRVALTMALYGFIVFVLPALGKNVEREMGYPLFVTIHTTAIFLIYHYADQDIALALMLAQVYLMAVYSSIYGIHQYVQGDKQLVTQEDSAFRSILAGKKILHQKSLIPFKLDLLVDVHKFLSHLNPSTKVIISLFNVALIVGQVRVFLRGRGGDDQVTSQLILWFGIVAFFVNYLLLRTIAFYHQIQRVLAFILINFGIYLTIINLFGTEIVYLMSLGMLWSILNSLIMFHTGRLAKKGILEPADYLYRIGANSLVTLCNIYFVFFLPLSLQFRFSIGAIYFGIQFFLTLYNLRFVQGKISKSLARQ